jgi:mono/diheme cytochrome c family protein
MMRASAAIAIVVLAAAGAALSTLPRAQAESQLDRGKYLVVVASCNDCHTPGFFLGKPDTAKYLGGSDVGFEIPGLGVFAGRNITPDKDTGIGGQNA